MASRSFRLISITLMSLIAIVFWMAVIDAQALPEEKQQEKEFIPGQFIVKFRSGVGRRQADDFAGWAGGVVEKKLLNPRTWLLKFDQGVDAQKLLVRLKADPNVVYAEPNGYVRISYKPNDPLYRRQWNFRQINVSRAWNKARGGGVVVAVVDTGVAYENYSDGRGRYYRLSDLAETRFVPGYDFVNNDTHPNDDNQHGSHVTGTIAQSTNNRRGAAGIAFRASIMPVKVLDAAGFGTFSDVADGVRWAADHGAHVINLSLGSSSGSSAMRDAVNYARYRKNVVVVAAAGNSGTNRLSYPAAYSSVISVAATDYNRVLTWYSQHGSGLDVSAPGGDTSVDRNGDGQVDGILQQTIYENNPSRSKYFYFQGTSMAAPHVSGIAALVRSRGRKKASEIISAVKLSATDLGAPGYDTRYGYGLVNAYKATRYRRMVTPKMVFPSSGKTVRHGRYVYIRWNRRRASKLRYHLSYSSNAGARGMFSDRFERARISTVYDQSGNANWKVTSASAASGTYSARSGSIGDSRSSEISLTKKMNIGGTVTFDYRISSEKGYDFFNFYIDEQRMLHKSGESGWKTGSFYVSRGVHTFRWVYEKDYSVKEGADAAFIDNIRLPYVSRAKWRKIVKTTKAGRSSYRWKAPNATGADYRIRIRGYNGSYGKWAYGSGIFTVN